MREKESVPLGIHLDDSTVHKCDHIAYFWETEQEFRAAVGFLTTGIDRHDHCVVFGYDEANSKVLEILRLQGFDPAELVAEERLTVLTAESTGEDTLNAIGA